MPSRHPVVGSWIVSLDPAGGGGAPVTLLIRPSLDGGIAAVFPSPIPAAPATPAAVEFWSAAVGEWEAMDEVAARVVAVSLGVDGGGSSIGTRTLIANAAVDPSGSTWNGLVRIETVDAVGRRSSDAIWTAGAVRVSAGDASATAAPDRIPQSEETP